MAAAGCWQYAAGQAEQRQSWLPVCGGGRVGGGDAGVLERRPSAVAGLAHVGVCGTHAPACWAVVACGLAHLPPPTSHLHTHAHTCTPRQELRCTHAPWTHVWHTQCMGNTVLRLMFSLCSLTHCPFLSAPSPCALPPPSPLPRRHTHTHTHAHRTHGLWLSLGGFQEVGPDPQHM